MATNKVIKSLNAQNYNGVYELSGEVYSVNGSINTDGQKKLTNISGVLKKGDVNVGSFSAWRNGDNMRYNFNDIQEIEEISAVSEFIVSAVAAVEAELNA